MSAHPLAIDRSPLRSAVRRRLLDGLLRGEPAPGASLNEATLASDLGVSRTPLREALLALEQEGLVRTEPGRGFFVMPLTLREAGELYPILWTLESLALRTAGNPPAGALASLGRLNHELANAQADADRALALDARWHRELIERCENRRLLEAIETLRNQAIRYEYAFMRHSGRIISSVDQHGAILAALREGRLEPAALELERNWRVSLEFLEPWLTGQASMPPRAPLTTPTRRPPRRQG